MVSYSPENEGARCSECPLRGQKVVPPSGSKDGKLRLVVVGEGVGRFEERMGQLLNGPGGQILWDQLRANGISRDECHVTSSCLCHADSDKELEAAVKCCRPRLLKELAALPPEVPVATLGKFSTWGVLNEKRLAFARGFVWVAPGIDEKTLAAAWRKATKKGGAWAVANEVLQGRAAMAGRIVFPSLDPRFVLRANNWLPVFVADMRRIGKWLKGELDLPSLDNAAPYEVTQDTSKLYDLGDEVSFDIETNSVNPYSCEIRCMSVSDGELTYLIWPWRDEMSSAITSFFKSRKLIVGHNVMAFDNIVLQKHGVKFEGVQVEDSLLAMHAVASHLPKSLSFAASMFANSTSWKLLEKATNDGKA